MPALQTFLTWLALRCSLRSYLPFSKKVGGQLHRLVQLGKLVTEMLEYCAFPLRNDVEVRELGNWKLGNYPPTHFF
ncbi:MAG: hypothetical protein R2825_17700 [Saprospiraceae bacterium]